MLNDYRFLSDEEPTDEQLAELMSEVTKDVIERSRIAEIKFQEELHNQVLVTKEKWKFLFEKTND